MTHRAGRPGIALVSGFLTGTAAGLVGVGGGEFRLPILVRILDVPLKLAATTNLVIGFLTVAVGTMARWGRYRWTTDDWILMGAMAVASVAGAVAGCLWRRALQVRRLKVFLGSYLVVVGLWMVYEAAAHVEHVLLVPTGTPRLVLGVAGGLLVALVSGALGVAGGELRLPLLLYLFGMPIEIAGTFSLAVSMPTVAAGVVSDWHLARPPGWALRIAVAMGLASVVGVMAGAALVPLVDRRALKGLLGLILIAATIRLANRMEASTPSSSRVPPGAGER